MSTDFESALREMMRERAGDVTVLPSRLLAPEPLTPAIQAGEPGSWVGRDDGPRRPVRRRVPWPAVAAAVVAVLAVVAAIVSVGRASRDRATTPTPSPAPSQSVQPTPDRTPSPSRSSGSSAAPVAAVCRAALPAAWATAMATPSMLGRDSAVPIAAASDGRILAVRTVTSTGASDVVLLDPTGRLEKSVFVVPDPDLHQVRDGGLEQNTAMIEVDEYPRGAESFIPTAVEIVLVNLDNGQQTILDSNSDAAATNGGRTIDGAAMFDGHVYWDVDASYGAATGEIRSYDLATGRTSTVFTGRVEAPTVVGAGLSWEGYPILSVDVAAALPAELRALIGGPPAADYLATDGTAYSWITPAGVLEWWKPGLPHPRSIQLPADERLQPQAGSGSLVVAGDIVVYADTWIIDTAGRAEATLPDTPAPHFAFGAAGVLIGQRLGSTDNGPGLFTLTPGHLPGLHC